MLWISFVQINYQRIGSWQNNTNEVLVLLEICCHGEWFVISGSSFWSKVLTFSKTTASNTIVLLNTNHHLFFFSCIRRRCYLIGVSELQFRLLIGDSWLMWCFSNQKSWLICPQTNKEYVTNPKRYILV